MVISHSYVNVYQSVQLCTTVFCRPWSTWLDSNHIFTAPKKWPSLLAKNKVVDGWKYSLDIIYIYTYLLYIYDIIWYIRIIIYYISYILSLYIYYMYYISYILSLYIYILVQAMVQAAVVCRMHQGRPGGRLRHKVHSHPEERVLPHQIVDFMVI